MLIFGVIVIDGYLTFVPDEGCFKDVILRLE